MNITWKHLTGLSPEPTPRLSHSSIFLCFRFQLSFISLPYTLSLSIRFIKSYALSQSCIGFYQRACYWYSLLQWQQWNGSDSWVVHCDEVVSRKTERYIRGRKKGWVADEPCKAVWQVNFPATLKKCISFLFCLPSAGWKMDCGLWQRWCLAVAEEQSLSVGFVVCQPGFLQLTAS